MLMGFFRNLGVIVLMGCTSLHAQQISYTSGSDFYSNQFQVQVSIGQIFSSFNIPKPLVEEGIFSVLTELLILGKNDSIDDQIQISPNPFTDLLTIQLHDYPPEIGSVEIFTLQGVLVEKFALTDAVVTHAVSHLQIGTYFLRVHLNSRQDIVQKVIKLD
jgi:hypothetical protein